VIRPRLLDMFCGAGGAGVGYARAGFDVVGVDLKPQPTYPLRFIESDAMEFLERADLREFQAVHASPPCQAHTAMSNRWRGAGGKADSHVDLIHETRRRIEQLGVPYVIENVPGARASLRDAFTLTGEMFGLGVHRPRLFESNVLILVPEKPRASKSSIGVFGKHHDGRLLWRRKDGTEQRAARSLEEAREAMGMPWADWRGCAEAIPPAYTEFIGRALLAHVDAAKARGA
jgi:DNA (cytosine-5)-methyltransferase 1